jgi:hypothetical protein
MGAVRCFAPVLLASILVTSVASAQQPPPPPPPAVEECPKLEASADAATKKTAAECLERTGKTASAAVIWRELDQTRADALEPKIPKIVVNAPQNIPGLALQRDGVAITAGAPTQVDPGEHVIVATAPGKKRFEKRVTVAEGETQTVAIDAMEDDKPPPPPAPPPEEPSNGSTQRTIGVIAAVAGLVAIGVGTGLAISAQGKFDDASSHCNKGRCDNQGDDLRGSGLKQSSASTGLFIGGGAALLTGVLLYLTAPRAKTTGAIRVGPTAVTFDARF